MIGRSALWVAKQHGHSIATMLRLYAAWTEGAIEADLEAIKRAMAPAPQPRDRSSAECAPATINASGPSTSFARWRNERGIGSRPAIWHWICHWREGAGT